MNDYQNCAYNKHIECTVSQCQYHSACDNYCTLDKIKVTTHEANPTMCQCTDCSSFIAKA
ncbi:MAG: DUF1540 domain-containing protein [Clostridia bacterium]|jgi:hypothetical protein|nr:DUF1540 domain-containing protein [Clostridia bacterium]MBQ1933690.1 DUF1540 domain-containing protein [Clostridia bacterium]MBQ5649488.1 DUF1540 domain-containing protein [Clostridia bacterium]MBQ5808971.1 DUF1540 domain-containing protein [Clostridia bacterium]MBR0327752.1 DUF1540 domain-containing protein [Clostridia bacterium]